LHAESLSWRYVQATKLPIPARGDACTVSCGTPNIPLAAAGWRAGEVAVCGEGPHGRTGALVLPRPLDHQIRHVAYSVGARQLLAVGRSGGRLCFSRHGLFHGEKHSRGWVTCNMVPPNRWHYYSLIGESGWSGIEGTEGFLMVHMSFWNFGWSQGKSNFLDGS
jgi:hypothetical protein